MTLILLAFATIFIYGFVPINDTGGLGAWHSTGQENGADVVYANVRIDYIYQGITETGMLNGVSGYGNWTQLNPSDIKNGHPSFDLVSPGENYKLIIKKGTFEDGSKTPSQEEIIINKQSVNKITFLMTGGGGSQELYNGSAAAANSSQYMRLRILLDDFELVNYGAMYKIYWIYEKPIDQSHEVSVSDLPITVNKILGDVFFETEGQKVTVKVQYDGTEYVMNYNMSDDTNMELFKTREAYYIKVNEKPQIYINHSDRLYLKDILLSNEGATPAFIPHTIWDLESNELIHVEKYNAYAYMKQNDKGVMISYFYVDQFIIDKMLSATLTYYSRQHTKNWFGLVNETTDWERKEWSYTNEETLRYRNLTSGWDSWIPVWNLISVGIKTNTYYEMPRIDNVDWLNKQPEYNVSKTEVEREIKNVYPAFEGLKDDPRYKLWAFALEEGKNWDSGIIGHVKSELYNNKDNVNDRKNLKVIEIVYETNGKLYESVGNDMDLIIAIDPDIDGVEKDKNKTPWWALPLFFIASAFVVGVINKSGGFKDPIKFFKAIITLGIGAAIIYLAYLYLFTDQLNWLLNMVFRL